MKHRGFYEPYYGFQPPERDLPECQCGELVLPNDLGDLLTVEVETDDGFWTHDQDRCEFTPNEES